MEKQRWDACVDCGVEKTTRKQRGTARCRPCGIRFAYQDPELRARVAEHSRKIWEDPAHREKVSTAMKERLEDPEMREWWKRVQDEVWNDVELRARHSRALKSAFERPEVREKLSTALKEAMSRPEVRKKMSAAAKEAQSRPEVRIRRSLALGGDGDLERIDRKRRRLEEYRSSAVGQWSMAVRERDGHRCQRCGANGNLHAHHVKPRAMFPELALELDNGLTLCKECHIEEHRRLRASYLSSAADGPN